MPANKPRPPLSLADQVQASLDWLEGKSTKRDRENLQRFAISATNALGVSMSNMKLLAKRLGRNHELAAALWDTGCYEARMLATLIDIPEFVTRAQMDRWCRDFDNWAICDTACFHLFDRTPHALGKVEAWAKRRQEFVKRAAFALLASMALHGRGADDASFARSLSLIESGAEDERNFVKKSVSWALRAVGRRSAELNAKSVVVAQRLAGSAEAAPRWVGKDALRELTSSAVLARFTKAKSKAKPRSKKA